MNARYAAWISMALMAVAACENSSAGDSVVSADSAGAVATDATPVDAAVSEVSYGTDATANPADLDAGVGTDAADAPDVQPDLPLDAQSDQSAPTVAISTPAAGAIVSGDVVVQVQAADDLGVVAVTYFVDGQVAATATTAPFSWTWKTLTLPDGPAALVAVARDGAGKTSPPATVTVTVLNAPPPTVDMDTPVDGAFVTAMVPVAASPTAGGPSAPIVEVEFLTDSAGLGKAKQSPWQVNWDTALDEEGAHKLRVIAKDSFGRIAEHTHMVTVDRTKPAVAFELPQVGAAVNGDTLQVPIAATASDASGVASVAFSAIRGDLVVPIAVLQQPPWQSGWKTAGLASGEWKLQVVATDLAGMTQKITRMVTLNRDPQVKVVLPVAAAVLAGSVAVQLQANDDLGVTSVALSLDGTQVAAQTVKDGATSSELTWKWDTTKSAAGQHTLTAKVVDVFGLAHEATVAVAVDQPLVVGLQVCNETWTNCGDPPPAAAESKGLLHWLVSLVDDNSTLAQVVLRVDGVVAQSTKAGEFKLVWDSASVADGPHGLAFEISSTAGEAKTIQVQATTNNCDLDHDSHKSTAPGCTGDDCNDADPQVFAGAADLAGDAKDQNCDGADGVDADGDKVASLVSGGKDCDDKDPKVSPQGLDLTVDGKDQDCSGVDGIDGDGDGYGSTASGGKDCNDADKGTNPAANDMVFKPGCDTPTVVQQTVEPTVGMTALDAATDAAGVVHIVRDDTTANILRYAQVYGQVAVLETIPTAPASSPVIAVAADGTPSVAFVDPTGMLIVARRTVIGKPAWNLETVPGVAAKKTGLSLGVDGKGDRHVIYTDLKSGQLMHAVESAGKWSVELVPAVVNVDPSGAWVSPDGTVQLTYYGGKNEAMIAVGTAGKWTHLATGIFAKYPARAFTVDQGGGRWLGWGDSWGEGLHVSTDASGKWVDQLVAPEAYSYINPRAALVIQPGAFGKQLFYRSTAAKMAYEINGVWKTMEVGAKSPLYAANPVKGGGATLVLLGGKGGADLVISKITCTSASPENVDENCDGIDGVDQDGDKVASLASGGSDCDDTDPGALPGATDNVGDGKDQNCDKTDGVDGDGDKSASTSSGGKDCDDANAKINPGAVDVLGDGVDSDCDGKDGADHDGDGYQAAASGGPDCDDTDKVVHPCADDIAGDGKDGNCDGKDATSCDDCTGCTVDLAGPSSCTHELIAEGGGCSDADPCTSGEVCTAGNCGGGKATNCDDGNACTFDSCKPPAGCDNVNTGAACDLDGSLCTPDFCFSKACVPAKPLTCDDGNACTVDSCNPLTGKCSFAAIANCCLAAKDCDDKDVCTADACSKGVCSHTNTCCKADSDCSDGDDVCTVDTCVGGSCVHGPTGATGCCAPVVFETSFENSAGAAWSFANSAGSNGWQVWGNSPLAYSGKGILYYGDPKVFNFGFGASSGVATLAVDKIASGDYQLSFWLYLDIEGGGAGSYDDLTVSLIPTGANAVTLWNESSAGVVYGKWFQVQVLLKGLNGQPIKLKFFFDTKDSVQNSGKGVLLDDLKLAPALGSSGSCDDGNACTADTCGADGACQAKLLLCNDSNPCTDDACDKLTGKCGFVANQAPCNDGDDCTESDTCSKGACTAGAPKKCGAGETCAAGQCVAGSKVPAGMAEVAAGKFLMGCASVDPYCASDEKPQHAVSLDAFYMDIHEVTVEKYAACVKAGACPAGKTCSNYATWGVAGKEKHPINCASWDMASQYCQWAGRRLPTEAEWEAAARGGASDTLYPWGNNQPTCTPGNPNTAVFDPITNNTLQTGCGKFSTWEPGSGSTPNSFGLYDMVGNVWEWVNDKYDPAYYAVSPLQNPQGPTSPTLRSVRGGSFVNSAGGSFVMRVSNRVSIFPTTVDHGVGFRCAASLGSN